MSNGSSLSRTQWLIIIVAAIGFLFDTYVLLMTPLAGPSAIAELLKVPANNPLVIEWMGRLLWLPALCGGVFGLIGGWLTDKLGRKTVMGAAIFIYSFSPVAGAYCHSLEMFVVFRCTAFIGVCVEFVAAITWLAEVFDDRKVRARWLGITQTFASLGGVAVTLVSKYINEHAASLPALGMPFAPGATVPGNWRFLLFSGVLPAIPIALMLPFVPESRVWKEKQAAGTLRRPSLGELFAPGLRRVTLLTAALSACAYAIAFGALQVTVSNAVPALPELAPQAKTLAPLIAEAKKLNTALNGETDPQKRAALVAEIKANLGKQKPSNDVVLAKKTDVQWFQEMGGLLGRVALALLLIVGLARRAILRMFQFPAVVLLPITYFALFAKGGDTFLWAYGLCGFLTVAQFSYFGEYLPKVFPLHLRGTGGSFATNVGGRMIGTSAAILTTGVIAPMLAGSGPVTPVLVAKAAGIVGTGIAVLALILGFLLPEPKEEGEA